MAEPQSPTKPQPEEMHWIALRMDVQEICQNIRELRSEASDSREEIAAQFAQVHSEASDVLKDMAAQFAQVRTEANDFRKEVHVEFGESRKDMAQQLGQLRQDMRHGMMAMLGFSGVLAAVLVAFLQYRLSGG